MKTEPEIDIDIERRLLRAEAVHTVHNLMGRYAFFNSANRHKDCLSLFALRTPGAHVTMPWGTYREAAGLDRFFTGYLPWNDGDGRGVLHTHALTTAVVEVADDLRTARAVWLSPGHETAPGPDGGAPQANWCWVRYACDFVQEDGEWKIWHFRMHPDVLTPYERSWAEPAAPAPRRPLPPEYAPDLPPSGPPWSYAPDRVYPAEPIPPASYASFADAADAESEAS